MTAPPSPPNRRRRRIVVVIAVLLLGLGCWWNWPRGDARFVGKWAADCEGEKLVFKLDANGYGEMDHVFGRWFVKGNKLVFGSGNKRVPNRFFQSLYREMANFTGRTFSLGDLEFDLVSIGKDKHVMQFDGTVTCVFTRIPE